jgi:hypothetical protein
MEKGDCCVFRPFLADPVYRCHLFSVKSDGPDIGRRRIVGISLSGAKMKVEQGRAALAKKLPL